MERPVFQPIGTLAEELDTPALVVDLDLMESNIEILHSAFRQTAAKVRPHVSAHQCPNIAHRQLAAGDTVGGIAVSSVGEADVFANAGFSDILVANQVVGPRKIARLVNLVRQQQDFGLNTTCVRIRRGLHEVPFLFVTFHYHK